MIIVGIIVLVVLVLGGVIAIAAIVVAAQAKAKKQALVMLEANRIDDPKLYKKVLKTLATSRDAEAPSLCQRLRELPYDHIRHPSQN